MNTVDRVREVVAPWKGEGARLTATRLDPDDFRALHEAGFTGFGAHAAFGGFWQSTAASVDPLCDALRVIARADPSVALVSSMHPLVLAYWNALGPAAYPDPAWREQCEFVSQSAFAGHWWGTLTSEPGSGGDVEQTRATTEHLTGLEYAVTGDKHFGSGSGVTSYMITTARVTGFEAAVTLYMDVRSRPWEAGDPRISLTKAWDGYGMMATQSHAFALNGYPATRMAVPDAVAQSRQAVMALGGCAFAAVVMGVLDAAMDWCNARFTPRRDRLGAYERSAWVDVQRQAWLAQQAFDGMRRAVRTGGETAARDALMGKFAIADLAENLLNLAARAASGSAFSRSAPLLQWAQDVRALGYLRPPWALMVEQLFATGPSSFAGG